MAEINPAAAGGVQQVNQVSQRPAAKPADSAQSGNAPAQSPSVNIDAGLLARIQEQSELQGVDTNIDTDGARSLAKEASESLSGSTYSIANQSPQNIQGLFR